MCARIGSSCNYDNFKKCCNDEWSQFTNSSPDGIIPDDIMEILEPKAKHPGGRPPKFKTPEELEAKAEGYFQYCDTHPIEVWQRKAAAANQSAKNGSGVKSDEGTMYIRRPYTLDGLGLFVGVVWKDFRSYHASDEFSEVIRTLEARVRDQQVSGAVVGMYNANLVARLNGISESVQVETGIPVKLVDDGMNDD